MRLPFLLLLMAAAACCAPDIWSDLSSIVFPFPSNKCAKPGVISQEELDGRLYLYDNPRTEAKVTDTLVLCSDDDFPTVAYLDNNNAIQFTDGKMVCGSGNKWYAAEKNEWIENTRVCCKGASVRNWNKPLRKKQEPEKPKGCNLPGIIASTELAKLSRDGLNYKFSNATVTDTTVECSSPTPTIVYTDEQKKMSYTGSIIVCEGDKWYVAGPEYRLEETNVACLGFATDENH